MGWTLQTGRVQTLQPGKDRALTSEARSMCAIRGSARCPHRACESPGIVRTTSPNFGWPGAAPMVLTRRSKAGAFFQPLVIAVPLRVERLHPTGNAIIVVDGVNRSRALPFVDLGMAVGKGQATGAIVVRRRNVGTPRGRVNVKSKEPGVDRVSLFID